MLKNQEVKTKDDNSSVLSLVFELGYVIAIPVVVCALGGRMVDRMFGTSPLFLLAGIFGSILISSYWIYLKIERIAQRDE